MTCPPLDRRLAVAPGGAPPDPSASARILYAEDNRINQVVGAGALRKLGFEVDLVDDGRAAIDACANERYGAVLMDVMMPDVDGYEATRQIRRREAMTGSVPVPIVGLSARAMSGDRDIALESGMSDYLTKPLRTAELARVLAQWITPVGLVIAEARASAG